MKRVNLILGLHNHQPVGNFDFVFEDAYRKAYLPFLQVLDRHPRIKATQHYSGILFEWILNTHPEFVERLRAMVERGQLEMMTGGYFEPILITIPDADKVGQIHKQSRFVQSITGYRARGAWLAERVWEPTLPAPLSEASVEYAVIDDSHFKLAGLNATDLFGYYVTESDGAAIKLFPISEKLRYTIPFRPPSESIEYLRSIATEDGSRLVVFADDGEKFGVWPGTHKQCYEKEWLDDFLSHVEENQDWIRVMTFSEALDQLDPIGRIYIPTASYREMMEWALPTRAILKYEQFDDWLESQQASSEHKAFVRGGFWRNFLAKYPESNHMHKRMLRVTNRFRRLETNHSVSECESIRDLIYASQCNCAYWHGVFGGIYLPHLRAAIYNRLVLADIRMDDLEHRDLQDFGWIHTEVTDFDADGFDEIILETDRLNAFFSTRNGGQLFELDYKPKTVNLLDIVTRREEAYHQKLYHLNCDPDDDEHFSSIHEMNCAKEKGLERYLNYDWYQRASLVDHFLHPATEIDWFVRAKYGEQGDFVDQQYESSIVNSDKHTKIKLWRHGNVWVESRFMPILVLKTLTFYRQTDTIHIDYRIQNEDDVDATLWFGSEAIVNLLAGDSDDRYYVQEGAPIEDPKLTHIGILPDSHHIGMRAHGPDIQFDLYCSKSATIWRFPIETISMSEGGFEKVYQGSVVMPHWHLALEPGEAWTVKLEYRIHSI